MTSSLGFFFSRATILRASSKGHAFECSANSRKEAAISATDITFSARGHYESGAPRSNCHLERTDRKIAQPQVGETAVFPQAEQRPIESAAQHLIILADGDADAFAEIAALEVRAAEKFAAFARGAAVEPKGKRNAVAENKVDLAFHQSRACCFRVRIGMQFGFGEQRFQVCLVSGAGDHSDFLAL